jgi:hypothetical protein
MGRVFTALPFFIFVLVKMETAEKAQSLDSGFLALIKINRLQTTEGHKIVGFMCILL